MLQAKYYKDFKGYENCLLIIGDSESFRKAVAYFHAREGGPLISGQHISIEYTSHIKQLFVNKEESKALAGICKKLADEKNPAHEYFSIPSSPDLEIIVSCGEYGRLPE